MSPIAVRPRIQLFAPVLAAALLCAACTGRLPGTGPESRSRPGVSYETVPVAPTPAPELATAEPAPAAPPPAAYADTEVPSYPSAPAVDAAPVAAPVAPAVSVPGAGMRDSQLAILTEAVGALREEISRSYAYSQELVAETKKLRVQLRSLRSELDQTRGENVKLRGQVRALEKRLKEIRLAGPVAGQEIPAAPAPLDEVAPEKASPADEPAPEAAPPAEDEVPEPPIVDGP